MNKCPSTLHLHSYQYSLAFSKQSHTGREKTRIIALSSMHFLVLRQATLLKATKVQNAPKMGLKKLETHVGIRWIIEIGLKHICYIMYNTWTSTNSLSICLLILLLLSIQLQSTLMHHNSVPKNVELTTVSLKTGHLAISWCITFSNVQSEPFV